MKYKSVKFYNEETKALTLVTKITDFEKQEVETKTYQYPFYVEGIYTQKAVDLGAELQENEFAITSNLFVELSNFFTELYGKQFTPEELIQGIHQNKVVDTFIKMLQGVLQGDPKNE